MAREDLTIEDIRQKWKSKASSYILSGKRMSSTARATAEAICRLAGLRSGEHVIELGCGHGRIAESVAQIVPGLHYTGVDFTQALLDDFLLQKSGPMAQIALRCADIHSLPFKDNTFDAAFSARVFQYLERPVVALNEVYRTLRLEGRAVIAVPNLLNPLKTLRHVPRLHHPQEVARWFSKAGFVDIRIESCNFCPYPFRWTSVFHHLEVFHRLPGIRLLGGQAVVSGIKK